ncbi:MAG: GNAT family protein [Deinococcota bacterium]
MPDKPALHGSRLTLRPLAVGDARALFTILNEQEIMRLTGTEETFAYEQVEVYCARMALAENRADYAITLRAQTGDHEETFLGEAILNDINWRNHSAHYRIVLSETYVDHGYGSEATYLMMQYAFDMLKLHRIELEVYAFNPRALHVYEKLGFVQEGSLRDVLFMEGSYHSAVVMSLLEHEFDRSLASTYTR